MKKVIVVALLCCLCLTGCELQTSKGTLSLNYDKDKVSDQTKFVDDNGKETVIHTESVKSYVDQLLDNVSVPNGGTTSDLKTFVYDSLDKVGIDLDNLDFESSEDVTNAENEIKKALEEQGVDTSSLDIDLKKFVEEQNTSEEASQESSEVTSEDAVETTEVTSEDAVETTEVTSEE